MRDPETIQLALTAAETGHLVFSTLHTIMLMNQLIELDIFPAESKVWLLRCYRQGYQR